MGGIVEIDQVKPLSKTETSRLSELEKIVEENFAAFVVVGLALREIKDSLLYRTTHGTFGEYVKDLWEISRPQAYRLIDAATVVENLSPIGRQTPKNERQARALVGLEPAIQIELWEKAVETAPDGKVTAAHVNKTVEMTKGEKTTKVVKKAQRAVGGSVLVSPNFTSAFDSLLGQIQYEIDNNWKSTDKGVVLQHLKALISAIKA